VIPDDGLTLIDYDNKEYEDQLFYQNDEIRINKKYEQKIFCEGLKDNWDSCAEIVILYDYFKSISSPHYTGSISEKITALCQEITDTLGKNKRTLSTHNKSSEEKKIKKYHFVNHEKLFDELTKKPKLSYRPKPENI